MDPTELFEAEPPSWFDGDVAMTRDMARRFFDRRIAPHYDSYEQEERIPVEKWREAGDAGLLCAAMPEEYGGAGASYAHEAAIIEALGHAGVDGFGIALHSAIVAPYILHHGTEEQKRRWLPGLASGELIGAIAMTEPGTGSDLQGVKTTALRDGNQYRLNGSKTFITNGQNANLIILVAKTDPALGAKGISLIVVETRDLEGFERGRNLDKIGLKANDTSELFFQDAKVPLSNLLGPEEGMGFSQLMSELPQERLIIANQAIASIERALALTIDYVKQRKAFGKALIEFQNTQFQLAQLKAEALQAKVFTQWCVANHLEGKLDTATASMAKMLTTDLQCKVMDHCLQLFGGYGYMNEYPIARLFRDARIQRIYGGTNEIMKLLISRTL